MWEWFGISDQGRVRQNNEDSYYAGSEGLFIVADGMGGAQAGELASRIAVDSLRDSLNGTPAPGPEMLRQAVLDANRRVMEAAAQDSSRAGMGTTLVAVLAQGPEVHVASVGDSRVYVYDAAKLIAITEDQTWVNEVGRKLGLDDASLRTHPMRHMLTMAIGQTSNLRVQMYSLRPRPGAHLLLCCDGLHGVLPEERIASVLGKPVSLETKARELVDAANKAGGPDNITAVLLRRVDA